MSSGQQSLSLTSAPAPQNHAQPSGLQGGQTPTPQQWLSGAQGIGGQGDPLTLLVGGMNQLQAALMKQMDGDQSPEAVKPGTTTLPLLKAVNPQTSPIDVQDWLELVAAPMSDLSNTSSAWWSKVRELPIPAHPLRRSTATRSVRVDESKNEIRAKRPDPAISNDNYHNGAEGHAGGGWQGLEGTFHCPHEVDEDNGFTTKVPMALDGSMVPTTSWRMRKSVWVDSWTLVRQTPCDRREMGKWRWLPE